MQEPAFRNAGSLYYGLATSFLPANQMIHAGSYYSPDRCYAAAVDVKVLFVIAEMAPLVKVGGLGDVGGALPKALREAGVDVRVALPLYAAIDRQELSKRLDLSGGRALWDADVDGVPVYLIEDEPSFGRENVYAYGDDVERFLSFCDTLLEAAPQLGWEPDVIHLNDWHPGMLATRLAVNSHAWSSCVRVSTIHNINFTGPFGPGVAQQLQVEEGPNASGLAQSILHADAITTVSPTYAREILTEEYGGALCALLNDRRDRLAGIINGLDTQTFDPATDEHLASRFGIDSLDRRAQNKAALQKQLGLPVIADVPLVAMVSRLFWQKGVDLAAGAIQALFRDGSPLQFVALGRGDEENEQALLRLAYRFPDNVAVRIDFDHPLGQLIYGACDIFFMPSRYEPGGLGQLAAMRYGAVPVVRRTGGLCDTVEQVDSAGLRGTGVLFADATSEAAAAALSQAMALYDDRDAWRALQIRGMSQQFRWQETAVKYRALYLRALQDKSRTGLEETA